MNGYDGIKYTWNKMYINGKLVYDKEERVKKEAITVTELFINKIDELIELLTPIKVAYLLSLDKSLNNIEKHKQLKMIIRSLPQKIIDLEQELLKMFNQYSDQNFKETGFFEDFFKDYNNPRDIRNCYVTMFKDIYYKNSRFTTFV
ncbi:MAG: hypothetical protein ACOCP8_04080 [archaeon]